MSELNLNGKYYWKSLEQLAETPEYKDFLHREFPKGASEFDNSWSRRKFLTLMGASMAMAGLAACRRPVERIVPYVDRPEDLIPGIPQFYATSMPFGDNAFGLVVESHEGRPQKIEGNQLHPSTDGASSAIVQAQTLTLFDPDRARNITNKGEQSTLDEFVSAWSVLYHQHLKGHGEGLVVLSSPYSSPTLARLAASFKKTFPQAKWVAYEPVSDQSIYDGTEIAFGSPLRPIYSFDKADVILSLDSDFLMTESDSLINARRFSKGRKVETEHDNMNRLYVVESALSVTGANADHRQALRPSQIGFFTLALARELATHGVNISGLNSINGQSYNGSNFKWISELAKDLIKNSGKSIVIAGRKQPASIQALVAAINDGLGNIGRTIIYTKPVNTATSNLQELKNLYSDMNAGKVSTLVMLGSNPVYNAPADIEFASALGKVAHTIQLSNYFDETSKLASWHVPQSHFLESWGDTRSFDGTAAVIQPLIAPLFASISDVEMVSILTDGKFTKGYDLTRETWKGLLPGIDYENKWRRVVHDGVLAESSSKPSTVKPDGKSISTYMNANPFKSSQDDALEISFQLSPTIHDGRYTGTPWLLELPHPITKITWDNAAVISQSTANRLGIKNNDVVKLEFDGRSIELAAWIVPGMADGVVEVDLGYGRQGITKVSEGVGADAYKLRTFETMSFASGVVMSKTTKTHELACTQDHWSMENRPIIREATLDEYRTHPDFAREKLPIPLESMFNEHSYAEGYQWGMTVDLNTCVGCNACTIACQSENNIAVVGREQVINSREMHWIRLDRYFTGTVENPETVHQPVLCQHCENAPCEQVCPVAATNHDSEGLNVMVYNRCVGTRYCSNNCPYKVRRFNFFNYTKDYDELMKMSQNPDVTVRSRGVMEKCTYCVQRITEAKKTAKKERRTLKDGEIIPACQQSCPVDALTFGNINDPNSEVSRKKKFNRNYNLLEELNVQPRTSYLAKLRNPNPAIEAA
jgi:molybdopterin-containing oxidoreductase family iron-sulfur binding subunit